MLWRGGPAGLATVAGIVAILLQGALPVAQPLLMPAIDIVDAAASARFPGAWDALCGGPAGTSRSAPTQRDAGHHAPVCPVCQAVQHAGHLLPPPVPGTPIPASRASSIACAGVRLPPANRLASGPQARAPPAMV